VNALSSVIADIVEMLETGRHSSIPPRPKRMGAP
jgi:hypothetical protein